MATTIHIDSFSEQNIKERTTLSVISAVDSTTLKVTSTQGFAEDDIIYVGTPAREGCERATVAAVADATTLTLDAALKLPHGASDAVTSVLGDKIRIYRADHAEGTSPLDLTYSVLATRDIDPDQPSTYYTDSAGTSLHWYRTSYYNAVDEAETALSEPFRGQDHANYASLSAIRKEAGFENATGLKDSVVAEQRRQAESEINGALAGIYTVPFDPVPEEVRTLAIQLAAAHLLVNAYGHVAPYSTQLAAARADLKLYADNEAAILDEDGNSQVPAGVTSYFGDDERLFRIGDLY